VGTGNTTTDGRTNPHGPRVQVVIVGPCLGSHVGGQAVQADLLTRYWHDDPDIELSFVPLEPDLPRWLGWVERIRFVRPAARMPFYLAMLWCKAQRADVIHIYSASYWSFLCFSIPACWVAWARTKKTVINYHSEEFRRRGGLRLTTLPVLRRASLLVAPSEYMAELFRRMGLEAAVVPNVFDFGHFPYRSRQSLEPLLVCTRGFESCYRMDLVVRAFELVKRERPDARLYLVGKGSQEQAVRSLSRDMGLAEVEFTGPVSREELWRIYDKAGIFINASAQDNVPLAILEAFASGTPVVSTAAGGIPYLVEHERTGLLCASGDWRALAQNVLRLLREPVLASRMASNAYEESRRYHWEAVRPQWLRIYRALAGVETPVERQEKQGALAGVSTK